MAIIDVTAHGVVAGASSNAAANTSALQSLINSLILGSSPQGGATIYFPSNKLPYYFNSTITIDNTSSVATGYADLLRLDFVGDGMDASQISSINLGANPLFKFIGIGGSTTTAASFGCFSISNLRFQGELTRGSVNFSPNNIGIYLYRQAYVQIENCYIGAFGTGLYINDSYNILHTNVNIESNLIGVYGIFTYFAAPNALTFTGSQLSGNAWYGAQITEAGVFSFTGGTITGNGQNNLTQTPNPGQGCGISILNGQAVSSYVSQAAWGATFTSVQFEQNGGVADVLLTAGGGTTYESNTGFMFLGCSFLREGVVGSRKLATNNIALSLGSLTNPPRKTSLSIVGCGFISTSNYTPSAGTPYVSIGGGQPYQVTEWGNVWYAALEMPKFIGPVAGTNSVASSYVVFTGTGVTAPGPCTLLKAFNVSGVQKNSAGNYTATFEIPLTDANYAVVGTMGGVGFLQTGTAATNAVTIQTFGPDCTAKNFSYISIVTFGSSQLLAGT